jgi:hypothetical protein
MTIHKSSAVTSGIMPDMGAPAGLVLCRSTSYTTVNDNIKTSDTLQMIPIPKNAKILRVEIYHTSLPAGSTGSDVGYGGDPDAFLDGIDMTGANLRIWPSIKGNGPTQHAFRNLAGLGHTFTADDTIDITFNKLPTKIPTSQNFKMVVFYKMVGCISDES